MERVTITMDDDLLHTLDDMVDGITTKSRSQVIDSLLRSALDARMPTKAVILAGGSREKVLSTDKKTPKSLIDINGKPALEHFLLMLKKQGITNAVIVAGNYAEKIIAVLKNGEDLGMHLDYVWENAPSGSAGAIKLARQYLNKTDPFILAYADVLFQGLDLKDVLKFHKTNHSLCTMILTNVDDPIRLGIAEMTGSRVTKFFEKPSELKTSMVNAGVFVCEPQVMNLIELIPSSFEKHILPKIAEKNGLYGYLHSGPWFHLETDAIIRKARKQFQKHQE